MRVGVGLVVKDGDQFIEKWLKSAEKIADVIFVVDNSGDKLTRSMLITHPKVKYYKLQKGLERNMSRDYQQILEMAREEDVQWVWNIDVDEIIPVYNKIDMFPFLINTRSESVGFPLFEMRGDDKHFVRVKEADGTLRDARGVHKCYKVLSHLEFNKNDKHGRSIPHNCKVDVVVNIPIQHFGHLTKKLRTEKLKFYNDHSKGPSSYLDIAETGAEWMKENPLEIKKWTVKKEDFMIWNLK